MIRTDADRRGVYPTEPFLVVDVQIYVGEAKIPNARSNLYLATNTRLEKRLPWSVRKHVSLTISRKLFS
jgi:hypothetical protein